MSDSIYLPGPAIQQHSFPGRLVFVDGQVAKDINNFRKLNWVAANEIDFPDSQDEAWRWVDLEHFPVVFEPTTPDTAVRLSYFDADGEPMAELPKGLILTDIKTAQSNNDQLWTKHAGKSVDPRTDKFSAMTAALADSGFLINVGKQTTLPGTILIEIDYGKLRSSAFSHHILRLEAGATAAVVLRITGNRVDSDCFVSDVFEISLGIGASLNLTEVQTLPQNAWQISHEKAMLEAQASLTWTYVSMGAGATKNFVTIDLNGEDANTLARGLYFASSGQHFDLDTQQNHKAPHTTSDLLFKGAANANGRATWEGMIVVDPIAQQTDGYQSNRNLILSESAEINAIPGLEICADDVKCSHGATVGRLNDDELFYLQCRGIPLDEAKTLIVEGFFAGVLDGISHTDTRKMIGKMITEKLKEG